MERKLSSMGMSASQARLLSITSRLTNNEFRAQTITNSKLRLASASQEASRDYMDALNSTQLMFMNYDDNGAASKVELTPAVLYDYAPMKNQYMLANSAGKILVANDEAVNYEQTDSLADFLRNYVEVEEIPTTDYSQKYSNYERMYEKYLKDKAEYEQYLRDMDAWNEDYKKWEEDHAKWLEEKKEYEEDHAKWDQEKIEYEEKYKDWQIEFEKAANDPTYKAEKAQYDIDKATYDEDYRKYLEELKNLGSSDMYKAFVDVMGDIYNPKACYANAIYDLKAGGTSGCYAHLLTHLLGYDDANYVKPDLELETSTGVKFKLDPYDVSGSAIGYRNDMTEQLKPVSERMQESDRYCDRDDDYHAPYRKNGDIYKDNSKYNLIKDILENQNREPEEWEILKSDFVYDPETKSIPKTEEKDTRFEDSDLTDEDRYLQVKTLKQKAIDLLYLIKKYPQKADYETIVNFTDGDFKSIADVFPPVPPIPPTPPNLPEPPYLREEPHLRDEPVMRKQPKKVYPPIEPIPPEPEYVLRVDDQPKAQWYVNLWYKMNGSDTANVVRPKDDDTSALLLYYVAAADKNKNGGNYALYDGNLFGSAEWLKFALEQGIVTMEQAKYYDPSEDSAKAMELTSVGYKWDNITYTSARDFVQQNNQRAIAIAEVKYKRTITEIENKDAKYDQDLKKLDTEHNALQTEYESIKEVLSKNVERSFKAFS